MHLIGNTKQDKYAGCKGQTMPVCPSLNNSMKSNLPADLRKVKEVVLHHFHHKTWVKCEEILEKVTPDRSSATMRALLRSHTLVSKTWKRLRVRLWIY